MKKEDIKRILRNTNMLSELFPNGATNDEMTRFGSFFYSIHNSLWKDYKHIPRTVKRLNIVHSAWEMMISTHVYHGIEKFFEDDYEYGYKQYLDKYVSYGGNKETFMKDLETQRQHLLASIIRYNVVTDSEGVTYNSLEHSETKVVGIELPQ